MKRGGSCMSVGLREEIGNDPEYSRCSLLGYGECGGRITREHALIYAGKKIQEKFAIIPLCASHHNVDEYQDAKTMVKDKNVWVALNRATDNELVRFSKTVSYLRERDRLNEKFGLYIPPPILSMLVTAKESPFKIARKPREKVDEMEREARSFARANGCDLEQARELLNALN